MNKFDQLVEDLSAGKLTHTQIRIAYKCYIRRRKDIPDGVKDLLCGGKVLGGHMSGLIDDIFSLLGETIGRTELAFRRGAQNDYGEKRKS